MATTIGLTSPCRVIGAAALAMLLTTGATARADIIPAVGANPIVTNLGGGNARYDFSISLSNTQTLTIGDFFTIYDFGPINAPIQIASPASWLVTIDDFDPSPTTVVGLGTISPDQSSALNYTFTANSAVAGNSTSGTSLGVFSFFAPLKQLVPVVFVGRGTDMDTGTRNGNITNTNAPLAAPEPASLTLLGLGLALGARSLRKRVKR